MRAVRFTRVGVPWEVAEVANNNPEPPAPGPGQALIAVEVSPVEQADLLRAEGIESFGPLPYVGGIEGMGRVLEAGPGVAHLKPGDRVLLPIAAGAWQERLVVPAATLFALPPGDPLQMGQMSVNPIAAFCLLTGF